MFTQATETAANTRIRRPKRCAARRINCVIVDREGYEEAQRMVRRRPAESVAVAFGTGLVVGLIVGLVASSRNS